MLRETARTNPSYNEIDSMKMIKDSVFEGDSRDNEDSGDEGPGEVCEVMVATPLGN
jgi:hypothetical protein